MKTLTNKASIRSYLKKIKKSLAVSGNMKNSVLQAIKQDIYALENTLGRPLTEEDFEREIGTAEEVSRNIESREDIDVLKKKAYRYAKIKWICFGCALIALLAVVVAAIAIGSSDSYHTTVTTYIDD